MTRSGLVTVEIKATQSSHTLYDSHVWMLLKGMKKRNIISQSGKTWKWKGKNISTALDFALDFKRSATLIEGFVKLDHLRQISDTPRHADCN